MKYSFSKIAKRLTFVVALVFVIAFLLFALIYNIGKECLDFYFESSSYIQNKEEPYIESLQEYVTNKHIKLDECDKLEDWIKEHKVTYFTVSKEGQLIYGITYLDKFLLDGNATDSINETWEYFRPVTFDDGIGDVFVYASFTNGYYRGLSFVSALLSIFLSISVALLIFSKEVNRLKEDLNESKERESKLKEANNDLIKNLAHDLRTPLTGLITYVEIIRMENKNHCIETEHIDKIMDKANQIKDLTDELFDLSLMTGGQSVRLKEKELLQDALEDYLSDFCFVLSNKSFFVLSDGVQWFDCYIQINDMLIGRIFNNLISNICKYADSNKPVSIQTNYDGSYFIIRIKNAMNTNVIDMDHSGIGLKNVELMMSKMGGKIQTESVNNDFEVTLWLPTL